MKKKSSFKVMLLTAAVVCIVIALFTTNCKASSENYDQIILEKAAERLPEMGFEFSNNPYEYGEASFEIVSKTETETATEYILSINGFETSLKFYTEEDTFRHATTNIKDVRDEYLDVIDSSKQLVCKYIDQSNILKDKEKLKQAIQETPFKEATNVSLNDEKKFSCAWFDPIDGIVYVSSNVDKVYVCEDTFVHELIHVLDYYTHNCNRDTTMEATIFSETITDLITESLDPSKPNKVGVKSCYQPYYGLLAPYLNLLGEDAIKAYFYGYDEVEKKYGDEFKIFVESIGYYYEDMDARCFYAHLIYKWYAGDKANLLAKYRVGQPVG